MRKELGCARPALAPSTLGGAVRAALRSRLGSLAGCLAAGLAGYVPTAFGDAFPPVVELGSLDGTNGFVIDAAVPGGLFGNAVSDAGDVNGDGFADLMLGAPVADYMTHAEGAAYVVLGGP